MKPSTPFLAVLVLLSRAVLADQSDECSLTSTVTDAKLTLSLADGRALLREGEIIPLVLSFTSTADKRYRAFDRINFGGVRQGSDTFCLEPEARDPLADYPFSGVVAGSPGAAQQLSEKPVTLTEELNEWKALGPGHYRLYVVSHRVLGVSAEPLTLNSRMAGAGAVRVVLRSNRIEFDVIKADAGDLAKRLQQATGTYENAKNELVTCDSRFNGVECPGKQAARRLRFLNTKESTEALARLYWSLNDQPGGLDLVYGLFGSPYRAAAIAAMQGEIKSPDHPITQDFLQLFTELQVAAEAPRWDGDPSSYPGGLRNLRESFQKMEAHQVEVRKAALAATAAALPQKTGQAHALTLVTLATEKSDLLDKETAKQARRQLIAEWSNLPEKTRADLIQTGWPPLDGTEALPILREIASQPPPHFGNQGSFDCYGIGQVQCSILESRNKALKRIYELDPSEGRSLILRDLSDPQATVSISLLKLLSSADLRPFVQRAVQRVQMTDARPWPIGKGMEMPTVGWDYSVIEQFADKSALGALEAMIKADRDKLPSGSCLPYAVPTLRYFLRVDPKVGLREVQASLEARKSTGCYKTLFEDLGKSLPTVESLAVSDLDNPDLEISTSAASALGRWGTPKAEPALWARQIRFHQEWPTGVGEIPLTDVPTKRRVEALAVFERTLLQSIATGANWLCGPEKLARLRELTSSEQRMELSHWIDEWEGEDGPLIITADYWGAPDQLSFGVMQLNYTNLDDEQIRTKLSQMPKGSKLYFQTYIAEQMGSPVSMEKQLAVLEVLRRYAQQFGVIIEERPR
jgi:hypothetical protein